MELPSNYLEEMKELLGDQYEAYLASFEQKTRQGLRVNTAKIAPETFIQEKYLPSGRRQIFLLNVYRGVRTALLLMKSRR